MASFDTACWESDSPVKIFTKIIALICAIFAIRTLLGPFLLYKSGCTFAATGKSCVTVPFILGAVFLTGIFCYLAVGLWQFKKWAGAVSVVLLILIFLLIIFFLIINSQYSKI